MNLAFVVQRYGADIAGGSEAHCRALAQRLSPRHTITVLTSCATDYVTWRNALPPGDSEDGAVRVRRFPVRQARDLRAFAELNDLVSDYGPALAEQEAWFEANGPDCPGLLDHLRTDGAGYDLVLFWTFRYAPSYFGVPIVADRAVLVPTAEEDPIIELPVLRPLFRRPAAYLFMTPEEQDLVSIKAGGTLSPAEIIGIGLDPPPPLPASALDQAGLPQAYFLYLGRVDENKGCGTLLDYYMQYADATPGAPPLLLAGPAKMRIPEHPSIRALGYVPDELRQTLLTRALALLVPSRYESLSIVLLEAWNAQVPAVVNGGCRVLVGQVRRANGGLFYRSAAEFAEALTFLRTHDPEREALGRQGRAYVDREYRWPTVLAKVERLLEAARARRPS